MFCECGSRKSSVTTTIRMENSVRRHRKCSDCKKNFFTIEIRELASKQGPQPDERGLYTPEAAVSLKMNKTLARRRIEDKLDKENYE